MSISSVLSTDECVRANAGQVIVIVGQVVLDYVERFCRDFQFITDVHFFLAAFIRLDAGQALFSIGRGSGPGAVHVSLSRQLLSFLHDWRFVWL